MRTVPEKIKTYFYNETKDFEIDEISFVGKKVSYFDTINCYYIKTKQNTEFYIFEGSVTFTNLYLRRKDETLNECYYKHIGFIAENTSHIAEKNFILNFIDNNSIFPILDRKLEEIAKEITLDINADQLSGLANQIRDCYHCLTYYLINKNTTQNPNFKNDNFTDNLSEFIQRILPGSQSDKRRNTINIIAKKGWEFNSELIHKNSIIVFDIMISYNIIKLLVSCISNVITGNCMPINKIKCPNCNSEKFTLQRKEGQIDYEYVCKSCKTHFSVPIDSLIKRI